MRSKFIITITVIIMMAISFSNGFADEFLQYFEKAQEQVSQKRYGQAAELFEAAAAFASDPDDEQTALYWVGVSYFKEDRSEPENAIRAFEQFLAKFKDSELKGEVNYYLGRCHVSRAARQDGEEKKLEIDAARQAFEEALNARPGETLIQKIRMMQAVLAVLNGESAPKELLKEALEDEFRTPRIIAAEALGVRLPETYQISGRVINPQGQPISEAKISWGGLPHAYTKADGQFKLSNLALWQTWLVVSAKGFATTRVVVDVPESRELSDMEIQLRYEATVVGRVIDKQGNPILRANIYYFVGGEGLGHNVTDVDGRYRLTGLDPQHLNYELMADHPDYAYKYQEIQISAPVEVQVPDMVLKKGRNISGVVTDEANKPIPFATVEHGGFHGQVKTDLQGRYRLKNIPDSIIRIRAYALGFAPVLKEISDNQQDSVADFVLGKGYTLSGQVTDSEGKPLKDALVSVYVHNWHKPLVPSASTNEAGRFILNNVPAGEIQLHASKDGYNTAYVQHTVEGDTTNLSLVLTPKSAFQFKIKVVDAETNQAIPAFEWALTESPGSKHHTVSQPRYELRQSADGTLEYFANEAGKIYDVFVRTEGYAPAVVREVRAVSQNEVKTVIVKLQRPAVVEGKVIADATGTSVPNARVQAFNEDHPITVSNDEEFNRPGYATAFTDANGRFSINVISPATDYLYITHPEVGAAVITIAQIENAPIRLTKDASIHGQALQDGKPVPGAHVYLEDKPLGVYQENNGYPLAHEMHIQTSEDGRFAFEHLLPGEYTVIWNNRSRKLELSAGETATITYGEAGGVDVFGTVRDESSKAVEGITVLISQQGSAETDAQGQYIIHDVPPGKYQIFAFSMKPPIKLPFKDAFKEEIEVPKSRERFQFDIVIKLEDVR